MKTTIKEKILFAIAACAFMFFGVNKSSFLLPWFIMLPLTLFIFIACIINVFKKNNIILTVALIVFSLRNLVPILLGVSLLVTDFEDGLAFFTSSDGFVAIPSAISFIAFVFLVKLSLMVSKKDINADNNLLIISLVLHTAYIISEIVLLRCSFGMVFGEIILGIGIACIGVALNSRKNDVDNESVKITDGYCDMTKHVLLLIFIGWIWQYVWIYRVTDYLNNTPNEEERDPVKKMLLCMFVPFYYIYWVYQSARRIKILAKEKNIDGDVVTLSVVLSLFIGIVPPIIMQSKINQICNNKQQSIEANVESKCENKTDKTEEIRNYKKLLDDGIITEEEFSAKKKQLLGI